MKRELFLAVISFSLAIFLSGCATMMPRSRDIAVGNWKSYAQILNAHENIKPYKTTLEELKILGFNPAGPNVKHLNAEIIRSMFLHNASIKIEDLPLGMQDCLKDPDNCYGYIFIYKDIFQKGKGNLLLRILKFVKKDAITGENVNFGVFLKGSLVVYRPKPEGNPNISEVKIHVAPLGPLTEIDFIEKGMRYAPIPKP